MPKTFYENFKENMDAMGAPCPASLFSTLASATATASALINLVKAFGTRVTLLEVIKAGGTAGRVGGFASAAGLADLATVGSTIIASAYAGIVVGSLAVAVDKTYCGDYGDKVTTNLAELYYRAGQVLGHSIPDWLMDVIAMQAGGMGSPSKIARNRTGSHHLRNVVV